MKLKNICIAVVALALAAGMTACGGSASSAAASSTSEAASASTTAVSEAASSEAASSEAAYYEAATNEEADKKKRNLWFVVHSLSTLIVTGDCPYSDQGIGQVLTGVSISICKSIKEIPGFAAGTFDRDTAFRALVSE